MATFPFLETPFSDALTTMLSRALRAAKDAARNASKRPLPFPVLFTHVPKCGGISVDRAIRRRYRVGDPLRYEVLREVCMDLYGERTHEATVPHGRVMALYAVKRRAPYVPGHFPACKATIEQAKAAGYRLLTVLRDPYDRLVSTFVYHHVRMWELGFEEVPPLGEVHDRYRARFFEDVSSDRSLFRGSAYCGFFGGGSPDEVAAQIRRYDAVGRTSDMPAFEEQLRRLGLDIRIGHANKVHDRQAYADEAKELKRVFEAEDVKALAHEVCAFDYGVMRSLAWTQGVTAPPLPT